MPDLTTPRCCSTHMDRTGTIDATAHHPDGAATVITSSQWQCPECGCREARPERWTPIGCDGAMATTVVQQQGTRRMPGRGEGRRRNGVRVVDMRRS